MLPKYHITPKPLKNLFFFVESRLKTGAGAALSRRNCRGRTPFAEPLQMLPRSIADEVIE